MKSNIIDIEELTDSRELLEKKPPHFLIGFIYIFLAILITLILWAHFGQKEVVVKAQGVVQAVSTNTIIPLVNGEISHINIKEGDYVQAGEELIILDAESVEMETDALQEKIMDISTELELLKKYENSINQNKNLFSEEKTEEKEYYYKYLGYQNQLKLNNNTLSQEDIKNKGLESTIKNSKKEINTLQKKIASLESDNRDLANNQKQIQNSIAVYEEQINSIQNHGELTEEHDTQLREAQEKIEESKENISTNEIKIAENKQMIQTYNSEINTYQSNIDSSNQSIDLSKSISKSYDIESDTYKNNELSQIRTQIKQQEEQLKDYNNQFKNSELQLQDYVIKAQQNGYIHFISSINENDLLQAGTEIIKINTDEEDKLKVELYIPATEISNISQEQHVKIHSYSLPYREYGFIESNIDRLDIDASVTQDNSGSYYKAQILVDNKALKGNDGTESYLKTGMPIEGQIITEQKSYLQLFLEKLELWVNS